MAQPARPGPPLAKISSFRPPQRGPLHSTELEGCGYLSPCAMKRPGSGTGVRGFGVSVAATWWGQWREVLGYLLPSPITPPLLWLTYHSTDNRVGAQRKMASEDGNQLIRSRTRLSELRRIPTRRPWTWICAQSHLTTQLGSAALELSTQAQESPTPLPICGECCG